MTSFIADSVSMSSCSFYSTIMGTRLGRVTRKKQNKRQAKCAQLTASRTRIFYFGRISQLPLFRARSDADWHAFCDHIHKQLQALAVNVRFPLTRHLIKGFPLESLPKPQHAEHVPWKRIDGIERPSGEDRVGRPGHHEIGHHRRAVVNWAAWALALSRPPVLHSNQHVHSLNYVHHGSSTAVAFW